MIPVLFSVSYAGYWGQAQLDLPRFFSKSAELGYRAVELACKRPHLSPLDYAASRGCDELRLAAERAGVEIVTLAGYTDFTAGRPQSEVPWVELQLAYVDQLARLARALGAKIVRVFSGYETTPERYAQNWQQCVTALGDAAELCARQGVVLGLQNHHDLGLSVAGYEALLDEVNHSFLRAMFDPWSAALIGEDLYESARRLAPRMVQTTLADYVRVPRFAYQPALVNYLPLEPAALRAVPLGQGFLDLPAFFAGLKAGGFQGYVAYEMCSPVQGGGSLENLDSTARQSLAVIQKLIDAPGA